MHHKIFIISFVSILLMFGAAYLFWSDKTISYQERRVLMSLDDLKQASIGDRAFAERLERYALDQIPFREKFRSVKASIIFDVLKQKDFHGLFYQEDHWFKKQSPYQANQVENFKSKIEPILQDNEGSQSYLFLIPSKSYYIGETDDFHRMEKKLQMIGAQDLAIKDKLSLSSYYLGDPHVKQDAYLEIEKELFNEMNLSWQGIQYQRQTYPSFYGAYQASGAYRNKPEDLNYYTNEVIQSATITYEDNKQEDAVYVKQQLESIDPYNVFLDGPSSLIKIENEKSTQDKTLLILRDSFGSALTPLLIPYYKTIYMVDLRYTKWEYVKPVISESIDDILLVYGQQSINESNIFK